jgi:hypothetical protein
MRPDAAAETFDRVVASAPEANGQQIGAETEARVFKGPPP